MSPDETDAVTTECDLPASPRTVWRALTTPEIVAEWLGPNDASAEPGRRFGVELAPEEGGPVACEVLEAVPHERLAYAWRTRDLDSVVTFWLAPNGEGGTRLRVVHRAAGVPTRAGPARTLAMLRPAHARRRARPPVVALRRAA